MEEIAEKTRFYNFFILYNNINFYEHVRDQRLHNQSAIVYYTTRYICFMKNPEEGRCDDPQPYYSLSHIWDDPQLLSVMLQLC